MGGQRHPSGALHPRKTRYPLCGRLGGHPGPVWTGAENHATTQQSSAGSQDGSFDVLRRFSVWLHCHSILLEGSFTIICYYWIGHGPLSAVCIMRAAFWGFVVLLASSAAPAASLSVAAVWSSAQICRLWSSCARRAQSLANCHIT